MRSLFLVFREPLVSVPGSASSRRTYLDFQSIYVACSDDEAIRIRICIAQTD
jgi:hypothetical protein